MPTIILTPSASSSGTSGWYAIDDADRVNFQYDTNATLGGAGVEITQIRINGRARNAASATKQLQLGFKPALDSARNVWSTFNGANVLDAAFAAVPSSSGGWTYRSFTRIYDPSSNATTFSLFVGHIRAAFAAGQPVYLGIIQPRAQYETQIDLEAGYWQIAIDYELLGNVPTTNNQSVTLGGQVTTTLIKTVTGSATTLKYKIGDIVLATQNIGTGASHTYTVPDSAGQYFPNTQTAVLTIEAETFVDGESYGAVSTSVTLTLPDDAAPTVECAATRIWRDGIVEAAQINAYVQRQSGVQFAMSGSGKYGASVVSYRVEIEGKAYTVTGASGSAAHLPIEGSGTISYAYSATDSRGLTATGTGTLTVLAWDLPQIAGFSITRVTEDGDEATDGTYAQATAQAAVSPLLVGVAAIPPIEQQNVLIYKVQYREIAEEGEAEAEWIDTDTATATGAALNAVWMLTDDGEALGGGGTSGETNLPFNDMAGYQFRLVVSDLYADAMAMDEMPTKNTHWALNEKNSSIGFGGEPMGTGDGPEYDFHGPVRVHGTLSAPAGIEGVTNHAAAEVATGGRWVDGRPIYRLSGMYAGPLTNGAQNDFPLGVAPIHTVIRADVFTRGAPSDGSEGYWWFPLTYINSIGGSLNYSVSYLINNCHSEPSLRVIVGSGADVRGRQLAYCIEYTKAVDMPAYYHLPYLVLAVGQDGCVVSSSSEFSSGYYNVYAFGGSVSGRYWACAEADAERWIQVQMPYKLKNMIVRLTNPIGGGSEAQYMPVAGTFQGSNDGSAWTQLGAFADRPTTAGGVTEHALNNAEAYKYLRVQVTQPGAGSWTGFGDIRVEGAVETEGET